MFELVLNTLSLGLCSDILRVQQNNCESEFKHFTYTVYDFLCLWLLLKHFLLACRNYRILNETDRKNDYHTPANAVRKCDGSLQKGWYRIMGAAGTKMPTQVVPIQRCGTDATGWLSTGHPTVAQGTVQGRVCFHWAGRSWRGRYDKPCFWSLSIRVVNCGAFFVYELIPIKRCHFRYCGAS